MPCSRGRRGGRGNADTRLKSRRLGHNERRFMKNYGSCPVKEFLDSRVHKLGGGEGAREGRGCK